MRFETISLLFNWFKLGVLLAILFRLSSIFELIAGTSANCDEPSIIWASTAAPIP